ncbi:holdfast attachment protein HfaB [Limnobacter thiooxidans]|uniref:Holdfast anchoring protein HfaB n=1 Tax=Limnobacter thiooxidans TaxID=131080 RepID=A0AA86J299_9BURK|nr:holdfast attachment protein HfaB [Limnobacter thiooxidans]BET27113.1 holdfast anchoring protein HfaB [Limnobacter thiooxidans]
MFRYSALKLAFITALAATGSACTTLPSFSKAEYVSAFDGASVMENKTRYSQALECLKPMVGGRGPNAKRFAVGRVSDFTGKEDLVNGKRLTQGAALMVISALAKTGVPMVERFDTSIADMELKYSDNKLITDNPDSKAHRQIFSGSLPGSDFHIVGGITEVNYNIRSGSLESSIRFIGAAARYFVMNVAVDLRVVNTKTLEVVNTQSLQKQIIGTELSGGYFRLFSDGLVDVNAAERTQEPIQKGVRMVIEQAVFNMLTEMNNLPAQNCARLSTANLESEQETQAAAAPMPVNQRSNNPIVLTPPPALNASRQGENVSIDSYTGEIVRPAPSAASSPSAANSNRAAAPQSEVTELKGLFGTGSTPQEPASTSNTTREMQEKLLWGSRPQIR